MERLLRGLIAVQDLPNQEDGNSNWQRFQEKPLDFSVPEDKRIFKYLSEYFSALGAPPDFNLIREYFEKSDDVEAVTRLDEIKRAQLYTRTNYSSILRSEEEAQRSKAFILLCRDSAAISEHGRVVEKPVGGKKSLRGPADALAFFEAGVKKLHFDSEGWELSGPSKLAEELDPVRFLMEHFHLAEGRPNVIVGYAGSAKTFLAIELALACASGKTCWGGIPLSISGPVVHLDYEMGHKMLTRRYQRMAHGMGIDLRNIRGRRPATSIREAIESGFQAIASKEVRRAESSGQVLNSELAKFAQKDFYENEDLLQTSSFPKLYLHSPGAEQAFIKLCTGKALLIIDSFRAATAGSGVDENNSEMRTYFDMLSKVSDRTGCVIVVLHHERKSGKDGDSDELPLIQRMRGSSGLADAVGATVHVATNSKGIRVEQGKVSAGKAGKSFTLHLKDVGDPVPSWKDTQGLALTPVDDSDDSERHQDVATVTSIFRRNQVRTFRELYELCNIAGIKSKPRVDAACKIITPAKNNAGFYVVPEVIDSCEMIA